jgi:hypothetical protein
VQNDHWSKRGVDKSMLPTMHDSEFEITTRNTNHAPMKECLSNVITSSTATRMDLDLCHIIVDIWSRGHGTGTGRSLHSLRCDLALHQQFHRNTQKIPFTSSSYFVDWD